MSLPVGPSLPGWEPPPRLRPTVLEGRHVTVRPLAEDDFGPLWESFAAAGDELWTYMSTGPFADVADLERTASAWIGSEDPLFFTFAVDGVARGWGAYLRIEPAHGVAEVGHLVFAPHLQRTPAATEAMYLMMRHVFELGYRRYEWKCDALNAASRRAAERLGFTYEGTFRQHMVYKGRSRDTAWYSIIDAEWPRLRDAFEAWLAPSNFDDQGRQLRRLADFRRSVE